MIPAYRNKNQVHYPCTSKLPRNKNKPQQSITTYVKENEEKQSQMSSPSALYAIFRNDKIFNLL